MLLYGVGGIRGTVVVSGQLVNMSSNRSCVRGMIHNKFYPISSGCPRPSIALQVHNRDLKHHLFIHLLYSVVISRGARWEDFCKRIRVIKSLGSRDFPRSSLSFQFL